MDFGFHLIKFRISQISQIFVSHYLYGSSDNALRARPWLERSDGAATT